MPTSEAFLRIFSLDLHVRKDDVLKFEFPWVIDLGFSTFLVGRLMFCHQQWVYLLAIGKQVSEVFRK
jgi:hypothetical protein